MVSGSSPRVRLASCREVLDGSAGSPDDAALLAALAARGIAADVAAWDDPSVDWSAADLVVIRSTWDYHHAREAFVVWCERVAAVTALANPAPVVAANTDKRYLLDLADAGVPVVPTRVIEPGQPAAIPEALAGHEVVVKPAVSADAHDTARYAAGDDAAVAHLRRLLADGRAVLVQPHQPRVDEVGETALVFVDGAFSHALRKQPRLADPDRGGGPVPEVVAAGEASAPERAVATRALRAAGAEGLLYARVDLLDDADAGPVVLELELTEPSLFLTHVPEAAQRLAGAIAARVAPCGPARA